MMETYFSHVLLFSECEAISTFTPQGKARYKQFGTDLLAKKQVSKIIIVLQVLHSARTHTCTHTHTHMHTHTHAGVLC